MKLIKNSILAMIVFAGMFLAGCGNSNDVGYFIWINYSSEQYVTVDKTYAKVNEKVTITLNYPNNKTLNALNIKSNLYFYSLEAENTNYEKIGEFIYSFNMPNYDVKIEALLQDKLYIENLNVDGDTIKWSLGDLYEDTNLRIKVSFNEDTYEHNILSGATQFDLSTCNYYNNIKGQCVSVELCLVRVSGNTIYETKMIQAVVIDEKLPTLNAPTGLKISDSGKITWTWIDLANDCGGFAILINNQQEKIQYSPYYQLDLGFNDQTYNISLAAQGVAGKSNASNIVYKDFEYKVKKYEITYNLNFGINNFIKQDTVNGAIDSFAPEREGYIFNGWFTSPDGGETLQTKITYTYLVTSNMTLYADWVEKESANIKRLEKPKVIVLGYIARWNAISGAASYEYEILVGSSKVEGTLSSSSTELNLSDFNYEADYVTLKLRAKGNGITTANSDYVTISSIKTSANYNDLFSTENPNEPDVDYSIGVAYWTVNDLD
ncbi:MAG: InlB B-repeat-containing protein, partial [Clostridia bacterium]|nr:InlB B-repeat-containing protein [Clostridia bacterium]